VTGKIFIIQEFGYATHQRARTVRTAMVQATLAACR